MNVTVRTVFFCCILYLPVSAVYGEEMRDERKKKIVYGMYSDYKKEFPHITDISPKEAMLLLKKGKALFVDTRKKAEMQVSMLPEAVSQAVFTEHPEKYAGRTWIAYCTIAYRSGKFAEKMRQKGIRIYNLRGGILAWTLEGGKIYDEKGKSRRIHVYGEKWDYVPDGYESVTFGLWDKIF
ncbi:MAG: rhodanese-like domain-containing protein [Desulfococcaceae bacterium]|jgi:sodium/bile acid cotransporter 7|nr:rhodanese-like domain-containing protein [Desulfococcaceae bacterium]